MTAPLRCLSAHAAISDAPGSGRIAAVYRHVCLLETDAGELISLAEPQLGNGPNALLLAPPTPFSSWPVGSRCYPCGPRRLCFEHGPVIDWSGARSWSALDSAPAGPPDRDNSGVFAEALRSYDARAGLLPLVLGLEAVSSIQQALSAQASAPIAVLPDPGAARLLIGLGPGSTPSGDDLVTGLLLTLHYGRHPAAAGLRRVAQTAQTTRLGRALLGWAARGEAREHTLMLLRALFSLPPAQVLSALAPVLEYGATSGADLSAGILIGLRLLHADLLAGSQ